MKLALSDIGKDPSILTYEMFLKNRQVAILRPLEKTDIGILTKFLENLSEKTRKNYTLDSYDKNTAQEFCDVTNRYDKLRFLLIEKTTNNCIGIFEYSLDIPEGDKKRFKNYNIQLNSETDCRIGPCLSDLYQNSGIGSTVFPYLIKIAKILDQQRMILWGGVFSDNKKAISFYDKNGFKKLGSFINQDNKASLDMVIEVV